LDTVDVNLSRERNSKLVPELLKRLKELQARGEEERERIRSVFKLD
jgi:formiminotetrahydrofolate cyclodeaminase